MYWSKTEINNKALAKYSLLKKYSLAWVNLDTERLKSILDTDVRYDAPGVPFDIIGIDHVLEAHKVWFDSILGELDERVSPFDQNKNYSCYEVFTQLIPYDLEILYSYMQLSYFVKDCFYKVYYFDIEINSKMTKITRINTRHYKYLVTAEDYSKYVEIINKNNTFSFNNLKTIKTK